MNCTIENIHPFIRFARFLRLDEKSRYEETIPYDHRLFYCYAGAGQIIADGNVWTLKKGDLLLFQSGTRYHLLTPAQGSVTYLALNFDYLYGSRNLEIPIPPAATTKFDSSQILEHIHFEKTTELNEVVFLDQFSVIEPDLLEMADTYTRQINCCHLRLTGLFYMIFSRIVTELGLRKSEIRTITHKIDRIIDYIQLNYAADLSNQKIGEQFHFHPNYINHLMVTYTGYSLHQYVLRIRIAEAIRLLETTDYKISEIAYKVGFSDISHFSNCFKKLTGKSPKNYI